MGMKILTKLNLKCYNKRVNDKKGYKVLYEEEKDIKKAHRQG